MSPRPCAVKPALESPRSYANRQPSYRIQSNKWQSTNLLFALLSPFRIIAIVRWSIKRGQLEPRVYGFTRANARITRVQRTRTGSTSLKPRITRVRRIRNGVHISESKEYPRGAFTQRGSHKSSQKLPTCRRVTGSTIVKPRTTPASKGYIGPLSEHTYRSNYLVWIWPFLLFELGLFLFELGFNLLELGELSLI